MKWFLTPLIFIALFFGDISYIHSQSFSELDKLKQQIEAKNSQIKAVEEDIAKNRLGIAEKQREARTLKKEMSELETTIKNLEKDISLTQVKIEKNELVLKRLSLEIEKAKSDIFAKKTRIAAFLRETNELNSSSLIEVLLKNSELSDFFRMIDDIEKTNNAVKIELSAVENLKSELESEEKEKESAKQELVGYRNELDDRKIIKESITKKKSSLLKTTKNKEAEYKKITEKKEREKFEILAEVEELEEELRKLIDPASLPKSRPGVLAYPVKEPTLTQGFGNTSFALRNGGAYAGGVHNGVDFRAAIGTEVYNVYEGEVWETGNTDLSCQGGSYGKWILIKHPNNLATLYAHLSLIKVSKNQQIGRGELIGYSGSTGYATGPHLHFTVYDSRTVRFGSSPSGRCKFLPFGGYLNPLDYL